MKNISIELIEVLLKTIDKMGLQKTIQVLQVSQNTFTQDEILINLILLNTCLEFNINENTLIRGRKNTAQRTNAIGIACVLLFRMAKLTQRQISDLLRKDPSLINKYIKKYENLDKNFAQDMELINKMDRIRENTLKQYELNK